MKRPMLTKVALLRACVIAGLLLAPCVVRAQRGGGPPPPLPLPLPDTAALLAHPTKPMSVKGTFDITALGDYMSVGLVAENPDPDFRKVVDIVRRGDVALTNQEVTFLDPKTYGGYAPAQHPNMLGVPGLAKDERALGINMVGLANNHSIDWGLEGAASVAKSLDEAGIVHAGYGVNRREAQAPRFLDTAKGRVALIATASSFKPTSAAQDPIDGLPARPGISTVRRREIRVVPPALMGNARALAQAPESKGDVTLEDGTTWREGAKAEYVYEINAFDRHNILQAIHDGKAQADVAIFTIHAHENANDGRQDRGHGYPAGFLVDLFHDAVDAGADIVTASGPHALRGIEIYKGKPILYGLGVFIFRANQIPSEQAQTERYIADAHAPAAEAFQAGGYGPLGRRGVVGEDDWNDGVIAEATFANGALSLLRLYPLDHQRGETGAKPPVRLATGAHAQYILKALQKVSAPFGTKIVIEGDVGLVRP